MFAILPERPPIWPDHLKPEGEGGHDKEPFETWWERHQFELGHLPSELCEQWVYRHWHNSRFAFLPLGTLSCQETALPAASIIEDVHREYGVESNPEHDRKLFERGPFGEPHPTARAFMERGTWDFPIVALRTPTGFQGFKSASENTRLVLIEGHQRHRYLCALTHYGEAPKGPHRVFIIRSPMVG